MAIDVSQVKSSVSGDGKYQSPKGSAGGGDIDFAALMRSSGARVANGLAAIADKTGITKIADDNKAAARYDDRSRDSGNDRSETDDNSNTRADRAPRHEDQRQSSPRDDRSQERVATSDPSPSAPAEETSAPADTASKDRETTGEQNKGPSGTDVTDHESASETGAAVDSHDGKASGQATGTNGATTEQAAEGHRNGATGTSAEQILGSLLAAAQTAAPTGKTNDHGSHAADKNGPGENAVNGLTNAAANATKNTDAAAGGTRSRTAATQQAADANTKTTPNDGANPHANQAAKTVTNTQATNAAATAQGPATASEAAAKDTVARQSAHLSKMIGDGPKVSVSVETKSDSTVVVSRPSTSLASGAALIGENGRGHQPQNAAGQNQGNPAQNQPNTGLPQAAAAQIAAQTQAGGSVDGQAKGPVQAAHNITATGPAATGAGGEGVIASNSVNATHQAQHGTPAQASNAQRLATPGHAVTDQVTVQITKAISAGADKISIHLKPADLGRVDVKMEVGHDGRVTAVVTADNKSTLDLLQRDSKELQQALQNAGMQMDNDSLSFNLRERHEQGDQSQTAGTGRTDDGGGAADTNTADQPSAGPRNIVSETRVDIRA